MIRYVESMPRKRHPHLKRARSLRNSQTEAERELWKHIRNRQLGNIKFRRQATIGNYIVDFVAFEPKLVVELDGGQHSQQTEYDEARTRWLQSQGFQVVRFWNHDVFENIDGVIRVIARELGLPD